VLELGSNGGQGYGVVGVSSNGEGNWLDGQWPGFARCQGSWVGALCGDSWECREQGEGDTWWVVGRVQWGEGGNWEGTGRVWTVYDMGRGSGGLSWEQLGKFFAGGEPESRVDCPLCENLSWGAGCGMQSGVCKVEGWVLAGG